MSSNLKAIVALADAGDLRNRVAAAMWVEAVAVAGNGASTQAQLNQANTWINVSETDPLCSAVARVVAQNSTVLAAGINGLDAVESNIQNIVNGVFNFFASS